MRSAGPGTRLLPGRGSAVSCGPLRPAGLERRESEEEIWGAAQRRHVCPHRTGQSSVSHPQGTAGDVRKYCPLVGLGGRVNGLQQRHGNVSATLLLGVFSPKSVPNISRKITE